MPSTYTQNLGIEQPATGEQAGVWGNTVNGNFSFFDTATDGSLSISLSANAYSLVTQNGVASEGRNKVIIWQGALTAPATVNIQPNTAKKLYYMLNQTTGGFPIIFQQGTGPTVHVYNGYDQLIYCDGAGVTAGVNPVLANPQFNDIYCGGITVATYLTVAAPATFSQAVTMATTTVTSLTINPPGGSQATYDMYYRGSSGSLVSLPIGTTGQALTVTAAGPAWTTGVALALGAVVGGAINHGVFFYGPGGANLTQDTGFNFIPGIGLGIGLVPTHALHIGAAANPEIWLDTANPVGQNRQLVMSTFAVPRWSLLTSNEAELGGNTGSNLMLTSYSDPGTPITAVFSTFRASGNITIGSYGDYGSRLFVVGGNPTQVVLSVRGVPSQQYLQTWQNSAGSVVASLDASGNFTSASSGSYVQYDSSGRVDLHGTVTGHPWGALHIGREPGTGLQTGLRGALAFETAPGTTDDPPINVFRIYFRNRAMVIQYANSQGFILYAYANLPELQGQTMTWSSTNTPI